VGRDNSGANLSALSAFICAVGTRQEKEAALDRARELLIEFPPIASRERSYSDTLASNVETSYREVVERLGDEIDGAAD
jgi:hypothetical protein